MRSVILKILSIMTGIIMASSCMISAAAQNTAAEKTEVWTRTDIVLKSSTAYSNPYKDVDIDAVFTHEDGTQIALYGFWNGGNEWRVRFAPTKTGVWNYVITCSDTENSGLHNVKGAVVAVKNKGETELDRHGFVKISDNGRYFVYDDGTPFFWLGDTNWQAPNYVSVKKCNYPGCNCGNQFFHEVNDRVEKGFTVYQTYFDSGESDGGGQLSATSEPSMWTEKYGKINPATFSDKYDVMFDYLAAKGMVIALGFGVHSNTVKTMGKEALDMISRYLTARYASYPVVWITAQEITGEEHFDAWVSSARIVDAGDGYGHPQSAHQYPLEVSNDFVRRLDNESWHDFYALQNGHGPTIPKKSTYQGYYTNKRLKGTPKPFVETEANYEDIYCGGFNGYESSRIAAWKACLCGSCGFTYGVTGIWANCYSNVGNAGWIGTFSTEPWYMGLDKPGSYEMKYMARFFNYVDFSKLIPRFGSMTYSDFKEETKVLASSSDNKTYAAYFYNKDTSTGVIKGLNKDEKYSAKWFDVLTGKFVEISGDIKLDNDQYTIPEKPDDSDWVLLVTSREDLGDYETEPSRSAKKAYNVNILSDSKATASSRSASTSSAEKAIDGLFDTWWCASSGDFPQWIKFEFKEPREFNAFALYMYGGTLSMTYTVECSDDGKNWETVYRGENEASAASGSTSLFERETGKTVSAKFVKFNFEKAEGNWAAVVEVSAYVTEKKTVVPEYKGVIQKPYYTCPGGYIFTSADKAKDTSDALFDGDLATEWKPFASESTQTVITDLNEIKKVYGINIYFGKGSEVPGYRIEGSNDRENWRIICDSLTGGKELYTKDGGNVISEPVNAEYRFIKIILMGASGKKAVKTVSEIEIYAEGETAEREKADISELVALCNKLKKKNNVNNEYSPSLYREFLIKRGDAAKLIADAAYASPSDVKDAAEALQSAYDRMLEGPEPEPETTGTESATEAKQTNEKTEAEQITEGQTTKDKSINAGVIAAICAGVAVLAVVVTVFVIKKRKIK